MNFKSYDILASLIPGFLALLVSLSILDIEYNNDKIVLYTAVAFLLGFIINTISSWLEDFYFLTWGGKPSDKLLNGKDIWKVRFYQSIKVKQLLNQETTNTNPSDDELFSIAMRYGNGLKDSRVEDFNAMYAFSRALLTTVFIGTILLLIKNYYDWRYYSFLIPTLFVIWLRCKQRAYYYAREILNVYLKMKSTP